MLSSSHSNMSVTYKTENSHSSHSKCVVHTKVGLLDILTNSKILWSSIKSRIPSTRHQHPYDSQNLPVVPITSLLQCRTWRTRSFDNLLVIAREYLIDSSIATYSSQPFEFVKTSFVTNRALCLSLKFHSFLVTLQLLGRSSNNFT